MIEIILILVIIATALITIIQWISKTTQYISEMRQRTIALNLGKEGVESMYNIRNTNWKRRSANRDQCWLKMNPMTDEGNDGCENDTWISKWAFILTYNTNWFFFLSGLQAYNTLRRPEQNIPVPYNSFNHSRSDFLYHTGWNFFTTKPTGRTSNWTIGDFYRSIRVDGLFSKSDNRALDCPKGNQTNCWDNSAKELRFCSSVFYNKPHQWYVEICAIMTNFIE